MRVIFILDNSETNDTQVHEGCEGDQNMNNKTAPNINSDLNLNILKRNFKHIKNDCTVLMKQISKINEDKQSEDILSKANSEALEAQVNICEFYYIIKTGLLVSIPRR